jgi:hypothetical protein
MITNNAFCEESFRCQALFSRYCVLVVYKSLLYAIYLLSKAVTIMPVGVVITVSVGSWKLQLMRPRVHDCYFVPG